MDELSIDSLARMFGDGMGPGFGAVVADGYVAIMHPEYGLAAVAPEPSEEKALAAAAKLTAAAAKVGVNYPAMHFWINPEASGGSPWELKPGMAMAAMAVAAMARGSISRPQIGEKSALAVLAYLATGARVPQPPQPLSPNFLRLAQACVERSANGASIFVAGVGISAADVIAPNFLLPAILVHAAQDWAIPVAASKGRGGFTIRLAEEQDSILGYKVVGIEVSSPVLLFLPIANVIRRSMSNGEVILDRSVDRFADFLVRNGLETEGISDVDVKVVASS